MHHEINSVFEGLFSQRPAGEALCSRMRLRRPLSCSRRAPVSNLWGRARTSLGGLLRPLRHPAHAGVSCRKGKARGLWCQLSLAWRWRLTWGYRHRPPNCRCTFAAHS